MNWSEVSRDFDRHAPNLARQFGVDEQTIRATNGDRSKLIDALTAKGFSRQEAESQLDKAANSLDNTTSGP